MRGLSVLVVGAGIGGLQTALALAADGHKVTVFESVKEFLEVPIFLPRHLCVYGLPVQNLTPLCRSVPAFVYPPTLLV